MHSKSVVACSLGRIGYQEAWDLQKRIQSRLIEAKRSTPKRDVPHVLLLVEHPPVYTLGQSGDAAHLLASRDELEALGATFYKIDRGGDITFHGPGQQVGYPILDLDRFTPDLHVYLRTLEEVMIDVCASYGIEAGRVAGRTGVWVGPDARGAERKVCAFGIRCSRWVTLHGWALNVHTDLAFFDRIVPCGIADRGVTTLSREVEGPIDALEVESRTLTAFSRQFDAPLTRLAGTEAYLWLESFLSGQDSLP